MSPKTSTRTSDSAGPRRRRTAEEAKSAILDAAEERLAEGGPEAVRLQDIAKAAGISHPTILHHFGSRDGLTQALAARAIADLDRDLLSALESTESEESVLGICERIFSEFGSTGHARLLAWRAMQADVHQAEAVEQSMLRHVTEAVHRRRSEWAAENDSPAPTFEDSYFVVRLGATALLGDAVVGEIVDRSVDPENRAAMPERFRSWLVHVLANHIGHSQPESGGD
ncbi:MAG: TetR/AcrR family transcriptional regulator [bacterium]|nr:TetR/AcrR family transcriptional regulator [bacterium]